MGVVYRALDPTIGRTVAIKTIRLNEFVDRQERQRVRERLLQEAQVAGLLSHPNIITIFDVLEEADSAHIVMEYVRGASLGTMLQDGTLPERHQLEEYFRQVADALDHAHRKGVIHRDIKSGNILISSEEGRADLAKISDFGISKFISQDTTHSGTMMGTPSHMSPEQIQGLTLDARSDQFSFGVVVYELLTGAKPFNSEALATLFYQICKQDPADPESLNESLDSSVGIVLNRALAKDPNERFPSCTEFIDALSVAWGKQTWIPISASHAEPAPLASAAAVGTAEWFAPTVLERAETNDDPVFPASPVALESPESSRTDVELYPPPRRPRGDGFDEAEPQEGNRFGRRAIWIAVGLLAIVAVLLFSNRSKSQPAEAPVKEYPANQQSASATTSSVKPTPLDSADSKSRSNAKGKTKAAPVRSEHEVASEQPGLPAVTAPVDVELLTQPAGAKLVIDNRPDNTCKTPCDLQLSPGRHTLTAELSGFNTANRIFTVPEDRNIFIALAQSMGVLVVTTEPSGSTVIVDGKEYGRTPASLRLPAGSHQLSLVNGSQRHEEAVVIQTDQFETRRFRWE